METNQIFQNLNMEIPEEILKYVQPDVWLPYAEKIRFGILIADAVLVVALIWVFYLAFRDRPRALSKHGAHHGGHHGAEHETHSLSDELFLEQWEGVLKSFSSGSIDKMKLAIIEADKLADEALKRFGLQGDHMADRLEKIYPDELASLDGLWAAHRVRNEIVHTPGYALHVEDARHLLDAYKAFFEEVKLLPKEKSEH